jgi:hypothetical protein
MRSDARLAALAGGAVIAIAAIGVGLGFLARERDYPATIPQPSPLLRTALVAVAPGARACWGPVVVDTHGARALIKVGTNGKPDAPLTLTLTAPGWSVRRTIAPTYANNAVIAVDVPSPAHDVAATACVANTGRDPVVLYAADDRTKAPYDTRVGRREVRAVPQLAFFERNRHSIAARLPLTFERMRAFRWGVLGPWLFWPLALLFVAGVPAGVLWAYTRAVAEDEAQAVSPRR